MKERVTRWLKGEKTERETERGSRVHKEVKAEEKLEAAEEGRGDGNETA